MPGTANLVKPLGLGGHKPLGRTSTIVLLDGHIAKLSSKYLSVPKDQCCSQPCLEKLLLQ